MVTLVLALPGVSSGDERGTKGAEVMAIEVGWLIETILNGQPHWYDGYLWADNSFDAVRFCRRLDAEKIADMLRRAHFFPNREFMVTEHSWHPHPADEVEDAPSQFELDCGGFGD
jgi:hypothetical protein